MKVLFLAATAAFVAVPPASASEINVVVTGISEAGGTVGCGLHSNGSQVPLGRTGIQSMWVTPNGSRASCRFKGLSPGRYAVAVFHDTNGNQRTDTNAIGLPQEAWGVSGNVRPALRAPRFDEAAVDLGVNPVKLTVKVK